MAKKDDTTPEIPPLPPGVVGFTPEEWHAACMMREQMQEQMQPAPVIPDASEDG